MVWADAAMTLEINKQGRSRKTGLIPGGGLGWSLHRCLGAGAEKNTGDGQREAREAEDEKRLLNISQHLLEQSGSQWAQCCAD